MMFKRKKDIVQKTIPVLFHRKEECCGCSACYAICPVQAIAMQEDEEGFLYPVVDEKKCVRCYQCSHICIFKEKQEERMNE